MSPTLTKVLKRAVMLAAVGFVITQMLPSLADQLTPNPVVDSASPTATPDATPAPNDSSSPSASASASAEPVADITYLESDSPTAKPKVIQSDSLFFRVPNSLQVDPRAHSIRTDAFALGGAENILVCIESGQANISLSSTANVLVQGQGSHSVNLSGSAASVLASLTSGRGVTAASSGKVAGANLTFRVAAVSKASVEPELCNDAKITRSVGISALGIDLNTVKVPVKIGKK